MENLEYQASRNSFKFKNLDAFVELKIFNIVTQDNTKYIVCAWDTNSDN